MRLGLISWRLQSTWPVQAHWLESTLPAAHEEGAIILVSRESCEKQILADVHERGSVHGTPLQQKWLTH